MNKYDYESNSFIKFSDDENEEIDNIRTLLEDSDRNIWIGTDKLGLYKYSLDDKSFTQILAQSDLSIRALYQDKEGVIWIGSNQNGLYKFNPKSKKITNYDGSNSNLRSQSIWALAEDSKNNIWIGTNRSGLIKYNRFENTFERTTQWASILTRYPMRKHF